MNTIEPEQNDKLLLIPLGGLGEIGKNMMAIQYHDDIIVIDAGLSFPSEEHHGVDYIIPDMTYLFENQQKIKGIILTHGHEDHIGSLNHLLTNLSEPLPPVFGTKLTIGLVDDKLSRSKVKNSVSLRIIQTRQSVQLGVFKVEFLKVCHSIADSIGLAITSPLGVIVHTGDFKFDPTPIDGKVTDYFKFAELGEKGVLLLMSDSTNVTKPGVTLSEREVAPALTNAIGSATGRVIVTTFASNIHRVQQIINISARLNRKVALVGRSMLRVTKKAIDLGYLDCPGDVFISWDNIEKYPDQEVTLLTTGAQGEPMAILSRIANNRHRIKVKEGDTVVISAVPIPGNEKAVFNNINKLFEQGAEVIYESYNLLHVSGHASSEELKLMLNLTKPRYFVPVHGETRHLIHHAELAEKVNTPKENIFVLKNGDILEIGSENASITGSVPAGKILIDGYGKGFLNEEILQDRDNLSKDGVIFASITINEHYQIVAEPLLKARGFIINEDKGLFYTKGSKYLKEKIAEYIIDEPEAEIEDLEIIISEFVSDFAFTETNRTPLVIPIVNQVL